MSGFLVSLCGNSIACDHEPSFRAMAKQFPGKEVTQLYRDYLDSFRLAAKGRKGL